MPRSLHGDATFPAPPRSARRSLHGWILAAGLVSLVAALGCAGVQHGWEARRYAGEPLSPKTARGAERLKAEMEVDATIASTVAELGKPDYFYIVDRQKLYFFYTDTDRCLMFERILIESSKVTELGRIPSNLLQYLPKDVQSRVVARRSAHQRRAQARARRAKAQIARSAPRRPGPASQAPGGAYIGGFETRDIVARMREPLTAADPGVSGWREARGRSGPVYSAKMGSTRYEVRDDRVAFTVTMSASRNHLPGSARLAIQRLNAAIFGAKADAVTDQMLTLAERAAADRSGRTAFAKRVRGRTIRIGRVVKSGVFAYSIHP